MKAPAKNRAWHILCDDGAETRRRRQISDTSHHHADSQFAEFSIDVRESSSPVLSRVFFTILTWPDSERESRVNPQK